MNRELPGCTDMEAGIGRQALRGWRKGRLTQQQDGLAVLPRIEFDCFDRPLLFVFLRLNRPSKYIMLGIHMTHPDVFLIGKDKHMYRHRWIVRSNHCSHRTFEFVAGQVQRQIQSFSPIADTGYLGLQFGLECSHCLFHHRQAILDSTSSIIDNATLHSAFDSGTNERNCPPEQAYSSPRAHTSFRHCRRPCLSRLALCRHPRYQYRFHNWYQERILLGPEVRMRIRL